MDKEEQLREEKKKFDKLFHELLDNQKNVSHNYEK